jgi:DNA-binding SARP family transcriptional activator/predicted ATPase
MLGPLEVVAGGAPVALGGAKARALLALLLLQRGQVVSREELIHQLWGERPPKAVSSELRVYVAKLRKALGPERVVTRDGGYALLHDGDEVDADRFRRAVGRGSALLAGGDPAAAAEVLAEGLRMWRGRALGDLADEPWARAEAESLEESRLHALEEHVEAQLALGAHADVLGELEQLIAEEPYRERPRAQLMLALYRCGRQADALAVYRKTRLVLGDLGLEPGPRIRELEHAILNHDPKLAEHEREAGNLPAPPTPFVGRRSELEAVEELAARPDTRLVTVIGPGGSGKTRLALEAATRLERELGVPGYFVELAPLTNARLVLGAVARAVGLDVVASSELADSLARALRERRLLLVLDNFEHVLDAAGDVARLLAAAPRLTIIATSRVRLQVRAERCIDLLPMRPPDAVDLFVERVESTLRVARSAELDDLAEAVCERVDHLPLAIELTAARARRINGSVAVPDLVRLPRLDSGFRDVPDRQRSLWSTIEWSYRLLDPAARRLFERVSVFRGSFDLEAAREVCHGDRRVVAALVEANVLVSSEGRLVMLETIREFAEEARLADEETGLRRRHALYYLGVGQRAGGELLGAGAASTLAQLELELANLRLAFAWLLETGPPSEVLRFTSGLSGFFIVAGRPGEGLDWILRALRRPGSDSVDPAERVEALLRAAWVARAAEDPCMRPLLEEALALAREQGVVWGEAGALTGLAIFSPDGDAEMIPSQRHAVALARSVDEPRWLGLALDNLSYLLHRTGDLDAAFDAAQEALEIHRSLGDEIMGCVGRTRLANVQLHRGELVLAARMFRQAAADGWRFHGLWLVGGAAEGIAAALLASGGPADDAVRVLGASEALFASCGREERYRAGMECSVSDGGQRVTLKQRVVACAGELLDAATYDRARAEGRALSADAAYELVVATADQVEEAAEGSGPSRSRAIFGTVAG